MTATMNATELTLTRTIPASPAEVFDAWLDPKLPCNPWNEAAKLIFDPRVDAAFYAQMSNKGNPVPHYGRFTVLERPSRIVHTWMSPYTHGLESVVTVTLEKKGKDTVVTLHHANLPDDEMAKAHEGGWGQFLDLLAKLTNRETNKERD